MVMPDAYYLGPCSEVIAVWFDVRDNEGRFAAAEFCTDGITLTYMSIPELARCTALSQGDALNHPCNVMGVIQWLDTFTDYARCH